MVIAKNYRLTFNHALTLPPVHTLELGILIRCNMTHALSTSHFRNNENVKQLTRKPMIEFGKQIVRRSVLQSVM